MNKKILSLIPILGSIIYTFYLFITDRKRYIKSFLPNVVGMLSFVVLYLPFALICNATKIDLVKYEWLVVLMFIISGFVWNVVYFLILSLFDKKTNLTKQK